MPLLGAKGNTGVYFYIKTAVFVLPLRVKKRRLVVWRAWLARAQYYPLYRLYRKRESADSADSADNS